MMLTRRQFVHGSSLGLLATSVAGCSSQNVSSEQISAEGATAFPQATLQDMVTYGDVVDVFLASSEYEIGMSEEEKLRGEGTTSRIVRVASTGNVLWTRPSRAVTLASGPPSQYEIADGGAMINGSKKREIRLRGSSRLAVGQRYVAFRAWTNLGLETASWIVMRSLAISNDRLEISVKEELDSSIARLDGMSLGQLSVTIAKTAPDPRAAPYMDLDPVERYAKILGS